MKVITINNRKGGTSKTTSSINIAYGMAKKGYKTLLIDLDPQANSSAKFCEDFEEADGIAEVFGKKASIKDVIRKTSQNDNLYFISSKLDLDDEAEKMLQNAQIYALSKCLKEIEDDFDYVVIDTNPGIPILLKNCVYVADLMILPVSVDKNSRKGVDFTLAKIIEAIDDSLYPIDLNYKILLTMVTYSGKDKTRLASEFCSAVREIYGDYVLKTEIKLQSKPAQYQLFDDDYIAIDHDTSMGSDYRTLVNEIEEELAND